MLICGKGGGGIVCLAPATAAAAEGAVGVGWADCRSKGDAGTGAWGGGACVAPGAGAEVPGVLGVCLCAARLGVEGGAGALPCVTACPALCTARFSDGSAAGVAGIAA